MNLEKHPSPNQSSRKGCPRGLVIIHGDAGKSDQGTISWIESERSKASYHYLVGRDGSVYQFVDESLKAWHAGKSAWDGYTVAGSVNPVSIGVAFANDGKEPYKDLQYRVGGELVADICKRHGIPAHLILGHCDVSPGRKPDPWKHFDWSEFYRWFGLYSGGKAAA